MDQNARQQIIDRLKDANNVLVTVSTNPSVDQLAACIGFTLLLNHLGKHGTAVFSGTIPSTIEFLKPEETLEKNTDSLRDFIIALDKSKADKLRYKVEDTVVKIFITPYRTSLSDKDLEFSQGDFNVDAVVALGVRERADIDKAIMAHGRILHDATVISINNKEQSDVGAVNLVDIKASSLSEMLVELGHALTPEPFDAQMATAFMTGIVSETDRFSNTKTSPRTMSLASDLMTAGANQQLIASKLQDAQPIPKGKPADVQKEENDDDKSNEDESSEENSASADGSLQIEHEDSKSEDTKPSNEETSEPEPAAESEKSTTDKKDDEIGNILNSLSTPSEDSKLAPPQPPVPTPTDQPEIKPLNPAPATPASTLTGGSSMALQPPTMGGQLTANSEPEHMQADPAIDPLSLPSVNAPQEPQILNRPANLYGTPIQPAGSDIADEKLTNIEKTVASPHLNADPSGNDTPADPGDSVKAENVIDAREAVDAAIAAEPSTQQLEPIQALGAQPVNLDVPPATPTAPAPTMGADSPTPAPFTPYTPPADSPSPMPAPSFAPTPAPAAPFAPFTPPEPAGQAAPAQNPLGSPPDMNGVNPNNPNSPSVPNNLMPQAPPFDPTASNGSATPPPPVPPPLMPPADGPNPGPTL